jgi:cytochrome b pre-mRNA-processing protein 3
MRVLPRAQGRWRKGEIMGFFDRFRSRRGESAALYAAAVARARLPHWYQAGSVPDTVDGRFDTIAAVLAMVMLRLEDDPLGVPAATHLAESFVDDMDPQLREIGIGDLLVGKHIGRMMAMLGGRLGAYREGIAGGDLKPALIRNLYRGEPTGDAAVAHVERELLVLRTALAAVSVERLIAGDLP